MQNYIVISQVLAVLPFATFPYLISPSPLCSHIQVICTILTSSGFVTSSRHYYYSSDSITEYLPLSFIF